MYLSRDQIRLIVGYLRNDSVMFARDSLCIYVCVEREIASGVGRGQRLPAADPGWFVRVSSVLSTHLLHRCTYLSHFTLQCTQSGNIVN